MPDPDLEMVGGGGGVGGLQKIFFGLKIRGGAGPLGPSPGSDTGGDAPLRNGGRGGVHSMHPPP